MYRSPHVLLLSVALAACGGAGLPAAVGDASAPDAGVSEGGGAQVPAVSLLSTFDLPRVRATRAISATVFDPATGTLLALLDREPLMVRLAPSADYKTWTVGDTLPIDGAPAAYDGEGLARVSGSFYAVTSETAPRIDRLDAAGKVLETVPLPAPFSGLRPGNKGIEALSASPSEKLLFFANEQALLADGAGPTKERGTVVRIVRRDLAAGADTVHPYLTEPLGAGTGGDMGVSEILAVSDSDLLVLERGFQADYGNTVRLYRVRLAAGLPADTASLPADVKVLAKELVVDLATLDCACVHPSRQPSPILDNYEALALGPKLADGRRVVFVTSDDNAQSTQVARIVTLALAGIP